jgi:hypothetical protein
MRLWGEAGRDIDVRRGEAFERMSRYAPRARRIEELTDDELALIDEARVSAEYDHLNALLD